ncbi:MAG: GNAT superfamily N-acetyltransferase [Desulforhopalus sp.]|jgi:GNAT superfamily N-acetyltransferase
MNKSEIIIEGDFEDGALIAIYKGLRAGHLHFFDNGEGVACLGDIKVFGANDVKPGLLERIIHIAGMRRYNGFRNRGIGTALLSRFFELARKNNVKRIYGLVVVSDLDDTPSLLQWYVGHCFIILPPDQECIANAKHKIELTFMDR